MQDTLDPVRSAESLLRTMPMTFPGRWVGTTKTECDIHRSVRSAQSGSLRI